MKFFFLISMILIITSCSKPKTVLICGDHVCINKAEAEQFFEENLTIEVKIIDKKLKKIDDLVELNLKENSLGNKKISITSKQKTNNPIKTLSNKEINEIKKNLKSKKKEKKFAEKDIQKSKKIDNSLRKKSSEEKPVKNNKINNYVDKKRKNVVDVCTILKKCSIDEISKYLLEEGRKKKFPDITIRQ